MNIVNASPLCTGHVVAAACFPRRPTHQSWRTKHTVCMPHFGHCLEPASLSVSMPVNMHCPVAHCASFLSIVERFAGCIRRMVDPHERWSGSSLQPSLKCIANAAEHQKALLQDGQVISALILSTRLTAIWKPGHSPLSRSGLEKWPQ